MRKGEANRADPLSSRPAPHPAPLPPPLTIAAVAQVGPDDVLLGEAEDTQTATPHSCIQDHIAVSHQLRALVEPHSGGEGAGDSEAPQSSGVLPWKMGPSYLRVRATSPSCLTHTQSRWHS